MSAGRTRADRPALALLIVAFALRLLRLGDANVWWDEGLAMWAVRKPLLETTLWTAADVHPPLFFWTLWGWVRLVGESELAARALVAFEGVVLAALAHALGRRLGGRWAGWAALLLVAVSRLAVWWSMELRMYTLAAVGVLAATYAVVRWSDAAPGTRAARRALVGYVLAAVAALYTVYLTGAALVALNVAVLSGLARGWIARRRWRAWLVAQLAALLLVLPWLAVALPRMRSWTSIRGAPVGLDFVLELWATLLATGVAAELVAARGATTVFVAALAVALVVLFRRRAAGGDGRRGARRTALLALGLLVTLPPLAVWSVTQPRSLFYSPDIEARYLVPFIGAAYVLAGWALAAAWRQARVLGAALGASVLAVMLAALPGYYDGRYLHGDLYALVAAVWTQAEPRDVVLVVSGNRYPIFGYYYRRAWQQPLGQRRYEGPSPAVASRPPVVYFPDRGTAPLAAHDWQAELERLTADYERVWLVELERQLQDPDDAVESWLVERWPRVLSEGYGPDALHLFARAGAWPRVTALTTRFPGVVPLDGRAPDLTMADDLASADTVSRGGAGRQETDVRGPMSEPAGAAESAASASATWLPAAVRPTGVAGPGGRLYATLFPVRVTAATSGTLTLTSTSAEQHGPATTVLRMPWSLPGPTDVEPNGVEPTDVARRLPLQVPVTDRLPGGRYTLEVSGDGLAPLALGPLEVAGLPERVAARRPVAADFGFAALTSAGYAPTALRPGQPVALDLYWSIDPTGDGACCARPPVVFAHLVGPQDGQMRVRAGQDGPPSSGFPLHRAAARDVGRSGAQPPTVFDRHLLTLEPDAPPGRYLIEVGLYDRETGTRYPVSGADADPEARRVRLGTVEVR